MKKLRDISTQTARIALVLLLMTALVSAGASSAERICQPVLEDDAVESVDAVVELKPDPFSQETDSDNMAGSSRPFSEQDAAQLNQWFSPTVDKPQGRRIVRIAASFEVNVTSVEFSRAPAVLGSLALAAPDLNRQATLVGAKPSGTM